jgi:hypothetical protein
MTTAPTYTRRPRNRTEGGVARWRQPSRPQQRLKRRAKASAAAAKRPPRLARVFDPARARAKAAGARGLRPPCARARR